MSYSASMTSTSFSKSFGSVVGAKRFTVWPSFEMRNLVKFHLMSLSFSTLLLMVLKRALAALAFSPLYYSVGACAFRYSKMGSAAAPFTSVFFMIWNVTP